MPRKQLTWRRKLVYSFLTCVLFFASLEGLLALCGVPQLRSAPEFWESLSPGDSLFVAADERYQTRPSKLTYFNPQSFARLKPPGTYRVFCLGGSTTYGHPFADSQSYVGFLRELLQKSSPETSWEVVNCGGISYASYRLEGMMQELAAYQPDLFIVYTGQNEFLEERTFREVRATPMPLRALQLTAGYSRTATVVRRIVGTQPASNSSLSMEVDTILDHSGGLDKYTRDPGLRKSVVEQYRSSLIAMSRRARNCGADILFVEPASNLRFSPFKSEHSSSDSSAAAEYDAALAAARKQQINGDLTAALEGLDRVVLVDPYFAEAHYWRGEVLYQKAEYEAAEGSFQRAIDEDVCPLRAISELHLAIREVAAAEKVTLVDFPGMCRTYSREQGGNGVTGIESFWDHVHPRPELHLRLAQEISQSMHDRQPTRFPPRAALSQSVDEIRAALDSRLTPSEEAMALCNLAQTLTWAGKIAESMPLAQQAVQLDPRNPWIICQHARLLYRTGQTSEAKELYERALTIDPRDPMANYRLGMMYLEGGDEMAALPYLKTAANNLPPGAPRSMQTGLQSALTRVNRKLGLQPQSHE